jgi:hypothetical protein
MGRSDPTGCRFRVPFLLYGCTSSASHQLKDCNTK